MLSRLHIFLHASPPGTYTDTEGLPVCIPCAPGEYASTEGSTSCTDCPVGTVAPWANFSYQLWPEAMLAAFTTSVGHLCSPQVPIQCHFTIQPHTKISFQFASSPATMQSCTPCPPGYKQPIPGQSTCVACEAGFYSPVGERFK